MALNARELLLIIRARDEAARVLRHMAFSMRDLDKDALAAARANIARGEALTSVGVGIAAIGAAGLAFTKSSIDAAVEYNRQAGLTLTQLDKVQGSLEDIKGIGRRVAAEIPVPFEQVQASLFDIFSSMDVTIKDSELLLKEFSKAAVAGQTDLQTAGRATIAILNAWQLSATEVTRINDVMFQLVRKGVGTYEQFASTIGRAIPSAVRAGQSIEELAGMLAFLTRNGLSTAMAAASAGRALDAFSNPTVVKRLKDMGIGVKDAAGEFRPISDIMTELGRKMAGLTAPQRAKALQELFKGAGGTIQARRFFDLAIKNYGELNQRVDEMNRSSGALKSSYDIMFAQPASKIQLMNNRLQILKTTVGDAVMPAFLGLIGVLTKVFDWFNNLSPTTQKWIAIGLGLASALLVIVGAVTALVGVFLILAGAAALAGIALSTVGIVIAVVVAAIVALGIIVFLVVKYHNEIWAFIQMTWHAIADFFVQIWQFIYNIFVTAWNAIWSFVKGVIEAGVAFVQAIWNNEIVQFYIAVYKLLFEIWKQFWLTVFTVVKTVLGIIVAFIRAIWLTVTDWLVAKWNYLKDLAGNIWQGVKRNIVDPMMAMAQLVRERIIAPLVNWLNERWAKLKEIVSITWLAIKKAIIEPIQAAVEGVRDAIEKITGFLERLRDKAKNIGDAIRSALDHLNPLSHNSPSLVDNIKRGFGELNHQFIMGLERTADYAYRLARSANDDLEGLAVGALGGGGSRTWDQEINVYTQEINPRRHAAELGAELAKGV